MRLSPRVAALGALLSAAPGLRALAQARLAPTRPVAAVGGHRPASKFDTTGAPSPVPESPGPEPRVVAGPGGTWQIGLPTAMRAALAAARPQFRPWRAADYDPDVIAHSRPTADGVPWAVVADLDGDGHPDATILGTDGHRVRLVAIVTAGPPRRSPHVVVFAQDKPEPGVPELHVLRPVRAGQQDACEGPAPVIPHAGVAREIPDKGGSTIFYIGSNGRPAAVSTGC